MRSPQSKRCCHSNRGQRLLYGQIVWRCSSAQPLSMSHTLRRGTQLSGWDSEDEQVPPVVQSVRAGTPRVSLTLAGRVAGSRGSRPA